jgi:hypothetical protein
MVSLIQLGKSTTHQMFGDISFIFVDNINVLAYWKGLVNLNSLDGVVRVIAWKMGYISDKD